jgi:O-antigen/teichoic acid export membrane protein
LSKKVVAKGALFIYIETLVSMGSGYIFWFIMSKITSPEIIGISSAIISLTTIFSTIASIGIPMGVQRFLGKSFRDNDLDVTKKFVKASFILTSCGIIIVSAIFILLQGWLYQTFNIDVSLLILSLILITSTAVMTLSRSIVISSLNTKLLPLTMIVGTLVKILLAYALVANDNGALGIMIGFVFVPILGSGLYSVFLLKIIRSETRSSKDKVLKYYKDIFVSSLANWIPTIIYTVGSHLGPLLVFGTHGSMEAGIYFIAFSLSMAVTALTFALFTIAYPIQSSMQDGRKRFTWRIIKLSLIIAVPISNCMVFYSKEILGLFGQAYDTGSITLVILLLSTLPITLTTGINNLAYSYGNYKQVLTIGLWSNIPRTILYFTLVPALEGVGAAISYTIGTIIGFVLCLQVSKKNQFTIQWRDVLYTFLIPASILLILKLTELNMVISVPIALVLTYVLLIKLSIFNTADIVDLKNLLPIRVSNSLSWLIHRLENKKSHDR